MLPVPCEVEAVLLPVAYRVPCKAEAVLLPVAWVLLPVAYSLPCKAEAVLHTVSQVQPDPCKIGQFPFSAHVYHGDFETHLKTLLPVSLRAQMQPDARCMRPCAGYMHRRGVEVHAAPLAAP